MLENSLRLAVDPVFPPPELIISNIKKIYIPSNVAESNGYELVFDEASEGG